MTSESLQQPPWPNTHFPTATLEQLTSGAQLRGVVPGETVDVVAVQWHGSNALTLTYRDMGGQLGEQLLYRDHEPRLSVVEASSAWLFDGDGAEFRLAVEALRIRMAARFDPMLAVSTSELEPLPHQLKAVYGELLPRTPLRFLLADDPGAGKRSWLVSTSKNSCSEVTSLAA